MATGTYEDGGHKRHTCNNENCYVCWHDLYECEICKCAEGAIPSECPGTPVSVEDQNLIYTGKLHFVNGEWIRK